MIVSRKTFWICTWAYVVYNVLILAVYTLAYIPGTFIDSLYPGLSKALINLTVETLELSVLAELLSSSVIAALLIYLLLTLKFKSYVKEWVFIICFFDNVIIFAFFLIPFNLFFLLLTAIGFFLLFIWYRNYPSYMISPPKDGEEENYDNQAEPTVSRRIFLSFKILLITSSVFVVFVYVIIFVFLPLFFYGVGAAEFGELYTDFYEEVKFFKEVTMILGLSTVSVRIFILIEILIFTFVIAVLMLKNIDTRIKEWVFACMAYNILYLLLSSFFNFDLFSASFYAIVFLMAIIWQRNYRYYDYGISSTEKVLNE